ncbi:rab11, putative [Entamoeba invadens IP1]|uniref:rab11, putative n=1 Tax=Entamoeba invadens IP1 TaxID=370355 RepID=UPI0002C3E2EE|nr:rab11, putative [Entamoeba invadens IP1]ELP93581.1 rab11, putative [Entamoeba invadens IP1]|eukprot:XP_004260352.1 rab11, putative [Entamoeba invadens IP1]
MENYTYAIKIVMVGETNVGKSSLRKLFINNVFDPLIRPTIGVDLSYKMIEQDDETIRIEIRDTAGLERYQSIPAMLFRNCLGAVVVYDITSRESFDQTKKWLDLFKNYGGYKDTTKNIFLVGNKSDLSTQRNVSKEEGVTYAQNCQNMNVVFTETSAKESNGFCEQLMNFIHKLAEMYKKAIKIHPEDEKVVITALPKHNKCC